MGYAPALEKAWERLAAAGLRGAENIRFFTTVYRVDPGRRSVQDAAGEPAKDFISVLVLHYLEKRLAGLPAPSGRWVSFKELESGEQYYPAFRKRSIDLIIKKCGASNDREWSLEPFDGVAVKVAVWAADEELPGEATILFDSSIASIFPTEDVAVLCGFIPKYL